MKNRLSDTFASLLLHLWSCADEAEKKARMERVVENRTKKYTQGDTAAKRPPPSMERVQDSDFSKTTAMPHAQERVVPVALTSSVPTGGKQSRTSVPYRQFGLPQTMQGRMFKHPPRELLPSDPQFYRRLTEDEKWILNDISTAFQVCFSLGSLLVMAKNVWCVIFIM